MVDSVEVSGTVVVVVSTSWPPAWEGASVAWDDGGVSWEEARAAGPLPAGLPLGRILILDLRTILSYCRERL